MEHAKKRSRLSTKRSATQYTPTISKRSRSHSFDLVRGLWIDAGNAPHLLRLDSSKHSCATFLVTTTHEGAISRMPPLLVRRQRLGAERARRRR